jgi:hypothetical protein
LSNEWMKEKGVVVVTIVIMVGRKRRTDAGETETPNLMTTESDSTSSID